MNIEKPNPSDIRFRYEMDEIPLLDSWNLWTEYHDFKIDARPTPMHVLARQKVAELDRWLYCFAIVAAGGAASVLAALVLSPRA